MAEILLSLCIPTYNRCDILDRTLKSIFASPDFQPEVIEVIVSDNCSTDLTAEVVSQYPLVRYYCNEVNIQAYNFERALSYARGKYIRIVNDTFCFKDAVLGKMIFNIEKHLNDNINLFFYPNFRNISNTSRVIHNIDELFMNCSFYTTWSASTGFWRKDFEAVREGNTYTELLFPQLHWMYNIVRNGKRTVIYFQDMYEVQVPSQKGGYNFFKAFVSDYLYIVKEQKLSFGVFEYERFRLFNYHILPWMNSFYSVGQNVFVFDRSNAFFILLKQYWYAPYFYPSFCLLMIKIFLKRLFA